MEFKDFRNLLQAHFQQMISGSSPLFEIDIDKDELWNLYLDSFPVGTNPIYRKRREFDCSCCRHFVKTIGNAVVIKANKIVTLWDFDTHSPDMYQPVVDALSAYIKSHAVSDVWMSAERNIGTEKTYEHSVSGDVITCWDHFYLELPRAYVTRDAASIPTQKGIVRDTRNVLKRSLEEFSLDAIDTILELIAQNSLYRGQEWKSNVEIFRTLKVAYDGVPPAERDNWCWIQTPSLNASVARIRNTSMGTLLINLSSGMDLDDAVKAWESIMAPSNYKRPKALFTKKMLADAQRTVTELGYMDSLARRFATLSDITVNNVLFSNRDAAARMSGASNPFAVMEKAVPLNPRQFSRVEEVSAEKFFGEILPTAQDVHLFLENRHTANMMSLIAPVNNDAKSMFKWNNGFSWAYTGNVTDSQIRENVKNAGGKVDGVLRFSIQWNDGADWDRNDEDAHCQGPNGNHIYFGCRVDPRTGGNLDVDITGPYRGVPAVENITWPALSKMTDGVYRFYVNCYAARGGKSGFRAEIEFNGEIYSFDYKTPLHGNQNVAVADVTLKDGKFTLKNSLPCNSEVSSSDVWGVHTNQFVPVTVAMYSPNYWDEQTGNGNRHYFFMLKDCVNPESPNGFYNEFVKPELLQHKRVFEALGNQMAVQSVDDQLSGVGFSSTVRNDVVVKVKGATERILKIKF